jgi:hypothetical protein
MTIAWNTKAARQLIRGDETSDQRSGRQGILETTRQHPRRYETTAARASDPPSGQYVLLVDEWRLFAHQLSEGAGAWPQTFRRLRTLHSPCATCQ